VGAIKLFRTTSYRERRIANPLGVGPNATYGTHVTHGTARVEAHEPPTANCQPLTANRQPLVLRLQSMVPEKIHEFLVVIRPDIEEDAHPSITTSGC